MITPEYLRECLSYEAEAGQLTWLRRPEAHFHAGNKSPQHQAAIWNAKFSGKRAFCNLGSHGYLTGALSGKRMTAHRVAWAISHGAWPDGEIDHLNGDRTDNRLTNMRVVSRAENARNLKVSSGEMRGVYWYGPTARWVAKIHHKGRMLHLGYFADRADAISARRHSERELGFHPNHGRAF